MEIWKAIEDYEGLYEISNLGRVRSIARNTTSGIFLKPVLCSRGYQQVKLCKDGKPKRFLVHRLVALAFLPKPVDPNATDVNHKDENKQNNCVENLEWCTPNYNSNYGTRTERVAKANSKRVLQFTKSGEFIREWQSTMEVQRVLGIANPNISACCNGNLNSTGGYKWKYK